ncbi:MAG: hypothetical protein AAF228_14065 [Pseudomonadota bacterium]
MTNETQYKEIEVYVAWNEEGDYCASECEDDCHDRMDEDWAVLYKSYAKVKLEHFPIVLNLF